MKVLVVDTETTGLCNKKYVNGNEVFVRGYIPHIVQMSWVLFDIENNKLISIQDHIVRVPDDVEISPGSINCHGITRECSIEYGCDISDVLRTFVEHLNLCDTVIAHNMKFDKKVIEAAFHRSGMVNHFDLLPSKIRFRCTMMENIEFCNIIRKSSVDGKEYQKYPTLKELHSKLFKEELTYHNSLNDVLACLRCFYKLMLDRDIIRVNNKLRIMFNTAFNTDLTLYTRSRS